MLKGTWGLPLSNEDSTLKLTEELREAVKQDGLIIVRSFRRVLETSGSTECLTLTSLLILPSRTILVALAIL